MYGIWFILSFIKLLWASRDRNFQTDFFSYVELGKKAGLAAACCSVRANPPLDQNHFKVLHLTRSQGTPSRLLTYVPVWAFCWRCLQWFFLSWYRKSEGTSSNPAKTHVFKVLQKDPQKIRVSATFLTEPKNNKKRSNRKKRGDRTLNELVIQETKVWFLYSATHWN